MGQQEHRLGTHRTHTQIVHESLQVPWLIVSLGDDQGARPDRTLNPGRITLSGGGNTLAQFRERENISRQDPQVLRAVRPALESMKREIIRRWMASSVLAQGWKLRSDMSHIFLGSPTLC